MQPTNREEKRKRGRPPRIIAPDQAELVDVPVDKRKRRRPKRKERTDTEPTEETRTNRRATHPKTTADAETNLEIGDSVSYNQVLAYLFLFILTLISTIK